MARADGGTLDGLSASLQALRSWLLQLLSWSDQPYGPQLFGLSCEADELYDAAMGSPLCNTGYMGRFG